MPIILYGTPASPPYRAVLLTARALGLELEQKFTDMDVDAPSVHVGKAKIRALNMPTLDDDGVIITKTDDMLTYLVDKYGKDDSLYPRDLDYLRFEVDTMLYFDEFYFYNSVKQYFEPALFSGQPVCDYKKSCIIRWLTDFDKTLERRSYAAANRLTIADFSLLSTVSAMESIAIDLTTFPNIRVWEQQIKAEIPFYDELTKQGIQMFDHKMAAIFKT